MDSSDEQNAGLSDGLERQGRARKLSTVAGFVGELPS